MFILFRWSCKLPWELSNTYHLEPKNSKGTWPHPQPLSTGPSLSTWYWFALKPGRRRWLLLLMARSAFRDRQAPVTSLITTAYRSTAVATALTAANSSSAQPQQPQQYTPEVQDTPQVTDTAQVMVTLQTSCVSGYIQVSQEPLFSTSRDSSLIYS